MITELGCEKSADETAVIASENPYAWLLNPTFVHPFPSNLIYLSAVNLSTFSQGAGSSATAVSTTLSASAAFAD